LHKQLQLTGKTNRGYITDKSLEERDKAITRLCPTHVLSYYWVAVCFSLLPRSFCCFFQKDRCSKGRWQAFAFMLDPILKWLRHQYNWLIVETWKINSFCLKSMMDLIIINFLFFSTLVSIFHQNKYVIFFIAWSWEQNQTGQSSIMPWFHK
jgi:hypothetical protein